MVLFIIKNFLAIFRMILSEYSLFSIVPFSKRIKLYSDLFIVIYYPLKTFSTLIDNY